MDNNFSCISKNLDTIYDVQTGVIRSLGLDQYIDDDDDEIDFSNISFINTIWNVVDSEEILLKTSLFLFLVIWGVLANIVLLYLIWNNPNLKSPSNLIIANMAAADLTALLTHPWIILTYEFFQNYQLGEFGCKTEGAFECCLMLASVMSITAISYDRLTAIVLPKETRLTKRSAKFVILSIWIAGVILCTPLVIYRTYKERQWQDFLEKYCTESTIILNIYYHIVITMLVWVPLSIMLICYIAIYVKLHRYEKSVSKNNNAIHVNYKMKVVKTMCLIVITFMICRAPFTALIFYRNHLLKREQLAENSAVQNQVTGAYHAVWFASKYFINLNAAINPVIYGFTNVKFLRAIKQLSFAKAILKFVKKPRNTVTINDQEKQKKLTAETFDDSNKFWIFTIFRHKQEVVKVEHPITDDIKVCT